MNDDQLRRLADTRPGYATYPDTRPGSPSWWRRPLPGDQPAPETTDGTPAATARDLCELVPVEGIGLICARIDHKHGDGAVRIDPAPPTGAPDHGTAPAAVVDEQHTWTTDDVERVCKGLGVPVQPWQALLIRQLFAEPPSRVRPAGIAGRRWWHRIIRRADR